MVRLILLALISFPLFAADEPALTILFSGEAHAALLPCDCPLQPLGGVARRAALIKKYRDRGPVLLLDAGGWAAGGMYDEDSDGDPARDNQRTELMGKAMKLMGYQAVIAPETDESESFGALRPANRLPQQEPSWKTITSNGCKAGIVSFVQNDGSYAGPWAAAAKQLKSDSTLDLRIALSAIGEDDSERMAQATRMFDLVINAARKSSTRVAWSVGDTVLANFDYQAQRLGVAEVFARKEWTPGSTGPRWDIRVRHEPLTAEIADDKDLAAMLTPFMDALKKKGKRTVKLEFFTMSECPGCKEAWPELEKAVNSLPGRVELSVHFVLSKTVDGKFRSLHGERELAEDRIQALVAKYYPERLLDWVRWRDLHRDAPWEEGARDLGLLRARMAGALSSGEADELLERDYQLSQRRRVQATPTLFAANRAYDGDFEQLRLMRVICGLLSEPKHPVCRNVPECFVDSECRKRGFIGECMKKGTMMAKCEFNRKALPVGVTVLREPNALQSNHERILEILLGYLPGLEWTFVDPMSEEGRALVAAYKVERFPAFLIDALARDEVGYAEKLGMAVAVVDGAGRPRLVLKPGLSGANRIANRPRMPGKADLFLARFSKTGQEALDVALSVLAQKRDLPDLTFHDAVYWKETQLPEGGVKRELAAAGGLAELQEAALAWGVRFTAPDKHTAYLRERSKRRGSLFWEADARAAGLDVDILRKLADGEGQGPAPEILQRLKSEADLLHELKASGEVVLLAENCEIITITRPRVELKDMLEAVGKRRK